MFTQKIRINKKLINNKRCFIVAEVSANHNKNFVVLKKFLKDLKKTGIDAVKLQAYQANTITINNKSKDFRIKKVNSWSKFEYLYKLYKQAETPIQWFPKIFSFCKKINLTVFASVFDESNLKVLEKLNCPAYKIASPEITDIPLIRKIAKTKKPIILSNGLADLKDLSLAIKEISKINKKLIVLKCTSSYPANVEELNLMTMKDIQKKFKCLSGFSDHTVGINTSIHAASLGACILEKHIKPFGVKTVDSFFSIDLKQLKQLITIIRNNEISNGKIDYSISKSSKKNLNGRRSLYVVKDIKKGEIIDKKNIKSIRPCYGIHPKYIEKFLGKKSLKSIKSGKRLTWSLIKKI